MTTLIKRSLSLSGHRTSVALESEFWDALDRIATERQMRFTALVAEIDSARPPERPLASALRVTVLRWCQKKEG